MGSLWVIGILLLAVGIVGVAAAPVSAETPSPCRIDRGAGPMGPDYNRMGQLFANGLDDEADATLGAQYGGFWLQPRDHGLYVGLAPGPIGVEAAYTQLIALIDGRYDGADAQLLRDHLHVAVQPYGERDLRWTQMQVIEALKAIGLGRSAAVGVGCTLSDAFRVQVELFNTVSHADVDRARHALAGWGDRVVLVKASFGPPIRLLEAPLAIRLRVRMAQLVSRPVCTSARRATVTLLLGVRKRAERVTLTVAGEKLVVPRRRYRRPLPIKTRASRSTTVHVKARLRGGDTITQTFHIPPCR